MPQRSKCVFNCEQFDVLHNFPKPKDFSLEKFTQWKAIVGYPVQGKSNAEIFYNYRICNHHFETKFVYPKTKRLVKTAYPTLNINKPWSSIEFQLQLYSKHIMLCHRHFNESSFADKRLKILGRHAAPDTEYLATAAAGSNVSVPCTSAPTTPTMPPTPPSPEVPMVEEWLEDSPIPLGLPSPIPSHPNIDEEVSGQPAALPSDITVKDEKEFMSSSASTSEREAEVANRSPAPDADAAVSTSPTPSQPDSRRQRRFPHIPRWVHELELRDIAAQERLAAAVESVGASVAGVREDVRTVATGMEAMLKVVSEFLGRCDQES